MQSRCGCSSLRRRAYESSRVCVSDSADIHSPDADPVRFPATCSVLVAVRCVQELVMPRRKKKFMLLRSMFGGRVIVVSRDWYDNATTISSRKPFRYDRKWKIMAQSDDESLLITMANLTDNHLRMRVDHTHEDEKGNLTNVRS